MTTVIAVVTIVFILNEPHFSCNVTPIRTTSIVVAVRITISISVVVCVTTA